MVAFVVGWYAVSLGRGLRFRHARVASRVELDGEYFEVWHDKECAYRWPFSAVSSARLVRPDSTARSSLLEGALWLTNVNARQPLAVSCSSTGFGELVEALKARGISVTEASISVPSLDEGSLD